MKVTVKEGFVDKITRELYQPGRKVEITDHDRVRDLLERGLIEKVTEEAPKEVSKETKKQKKK